MKNKLRFIFIIICFIIPFILMTTLSIFKQYRYPDLLPKVFSFDNWKDILADQTYTNSIIQSIITAMGASITSTLLGFMLARFLTTSKSMFSKIIRNIYSFPLYIPSMVLFIGVHQMSIYLSIANNIYGVILVHSLISIPYSTNIAIAYFEGISNQLEAIATTLGCNTRKLWSFVLLPLLKPAIVLSLAISFLLSFSEYLATALIGGSNVITLSRVMYPLISNGNLQKGTALSLIFLLVNLIIFCIADFIVKKNKAKGYLYI